MHPSCQFLYKLITWLNRFEKFQREDPAVIFPMAIAHRYKEYAAALKSPMTESQSKLLQRRGLIKPPHIISIR